MIEPMGFGRAASVEGGWSIARERREPIRLERCDTKSSGPKPSQSSRRGGSVFDACRGQAFPISSRAHRSNGPSREGD